MRPLFTQITPNDFDPTSYTTTIRSFAQAADTVIPDRAVRLREPKPGAKIKHTLTTITPGSLTAMLARDGSIFAYLPIQGSDSLHERYDVWREQPAQTVAAQSASAQSPSNRASKILEGELNEAQLAMLGGVLLRDDSPISTPERKSLSEEERKNRARINAALKLNPGVFGG